MPRGPHNSTITWTPHLRVSWGGFLGGASGEIWTNSVKFVPAGSVAPTPEEIQSSLQPVADAVTMWMTGQQNNAGTEDPASFISNQASLNWVKLNWILDTGLQRDNVTHELDVANVVGVQSAQVPYYQTFALTFRTAKLRGRGHVGRIYPPVVTRAIQASGRISINDASAMAHAGSELLKALNTGISATTVGTIALLSPANSVKGYLALRQNIIAVECDTVPDVQHRRTDRLKRQIGTVFSTLATP